MLSKVRKHIPQFLEEYLVFVDIFVDCYKQKTCLILTENLKFFEYSQKQLLNSIDLGNTCLSKLIDELRQYQGPVNKFINYMKPTTTSGQHKALPTVNDDVYFGKYIYHCIDMQKTYLLIKCWDKLVILQRISEGKGFKIEAEYENLLSYKLVHGPLKYCAILELKFQNGDVLKTDFQNETLDDKANKADILQECSNTVEFNKLLERIRNAKTELHIHENITASIFQRLSQQLTFGLPYMRSLKIEEKQMLARCGDIWKRLTPHDHLVIGVPLVNQCSPPNLTILRNLRPALQVNPPETQVLSCEYRLYQLKRQFHELDSLEVFLQSEDNQLQDAVWLPDNQLQLLPDSFAVMVIKFQLCDILNLTQCPLFILYEIAKDFALSRQEEGVAKTYPLQIFLQNMDFHQICFEERKNYEITFNMKTIHQDFLSIAITSIETTLKFTFNCSSDLNIFIHLLQEEYDMEKLPLTVAEEDVDMEMSNFAPKQSQHFPNMLLYNCKTNSLWYGCLILHLNDYNCSANYDNDYFSSTWKFYLPNSEKSLIFMKSLFTELISSKCNVRKVDNCITTNCQNSVSQFENSLRQELNQLREFLNNKPEKYSQKWFQIVENFSKSQTETDLISLWLKDDK